MPKKKSLTAAQLADLYFEAKNERLQFAKQLEEMDRREKDLRQQVIAALNNEGVEGVSTKKVRVTLVSKIFPKVVDWEQVQKYIKKTNNWFVMQRRLSDAAIKEIWEDGKQIPGIESDSILVLSVNKVNR